MRLLPSMRLLSFLLAVHLYFSAGFAPSATAQSPTQVRISAGVAQGLLIKKVNPLYPDEAKNQRIQGTVILGVVISETGSVLSVSEVSGDPILISAAGAAVRQWQYRPYSLNGQPVRVETQVIVNFTLAAPATPLSSSRNEPAASPADTMSTWTDDSGLMWETASAPRSDWLHARLHCSELRLLDFSDWRLPTIPELQTLYDPSASQEVVIDLSSGVQPLVFQVHINGHVRVTAYSLWSSDSAGTPNQYGIPYYSTFLFGGAHSKISQPLSEHSGVPGTLCVRTVNIQQTSDRAAQSPSDVPRNAEASIDYNEQLKSAVGLYKGKQLSQATEAVAALIKVDPSRWEGYQLLGLINEDQHKLTQAKEAYKRALSIAPDNIKPQIMQAIQQVGGSN